MKNKFFAYRNISQKDVNYKINIKELALLNEKEIKELPLDFIAILNSSHIKYLGYEFVSKLSAQQLGTIVPSRLCILPIQDLKNLYAKFKKDKTKTFEIKIAKINNQFETIQLNTGVISSKIKKAIQLNKNRQKFTENGLKLDLTKDSFTINEVADYFRYPHLYNKKIIMDLFNDSETISNDELLSVVNKLYNGEQKFNELPRLYSLRDLEIIYQVSYKSIYHKLRQHKLPFVSFKEKNGKPLVTDDVKEKIFEIKQIA